ncbi:MAG TPA: radical SAM protein [Sumerlaeia bacterium]|nr:radical SAM protein [Sumerlaeia bacterium]
MNGKPIRRVLLVVPPTGLYIREDRCQTPIEHMTTVTLRPPIDLLYAGACFERGGARCRLVDYPGEGWGRDRLEADLRGFQPDLALLSITTPGFEDDMAVAAFIKSVWPGAIVAAKGAHFNTLDREALAQHPALDLALRGEFETACEELAQGRAWGEIAGLTFRAEQSRIVRTQDPPFINDLDRLPFPARHLSNNALYIRPDTGETQTTVITNRGCPYDCCFCLAGQVAGRRVRARTAENVLDEVEECVERFGIRNFLFRSDLFTARREWVLEVCRGIRERGLREPGRAIAWSCNSRVDTVDPDLLEEMKWAGCWIIAFGVESGDQDTLDRMGKKTDLNAARRALEMTRRAGILSSVYFVIGLPWETRETLEANDRFAREIDPDVLEIFYAYPFPGTALYDEAVGLGLLRAGEVPRQAYDEPAMASLELSREDLAQARNRALRRFYLRPGVVLRTLRRAGSARAAANYVRYGWRMLKELL